MKVKIVLSTMFVLFCICLLIISGCGTSNQTPTVNTPPGYSRLWNMSIYQGTGVDPTCGNYNLDYTVGTGLVPFTVTLEDGTKYMKFTASNNRVDKIPINNGAFYFEWGELGQWHPGSHHPTDSYAISGCFIDARHAVGIIKNAYAGAITNESEFTAAMY